MKKTITIIGVNFYPEDTAIGLYTTQLAEYFQNENIEVKIITGFPYYPSWKIDEKYTKKKTFLKENINSIAVYRYKQYVPESPTFFKRIIHLLDFSIGSFINTFNIKNTDVVLCIVPFTTTIFLGNFLSKYKKAKLWVHIQDFEFDAASQSKIVNQNEIKKNIFFKFLFWIERKLLNQADVVSTISNAMFNKLNEKRNKTNSNKLLPNWVDLEKINPEKSNTHSYLKSKKFKILYSGNIGEKQDWKFFLDFAKELKSSSEVEIIIVGDGSKKEWLVENTKEYLNIIHFFPVDYENLSNLLCSTDLHFLFQKNDIIDTVMPSKILAMIASCKPSLITGNLESEVATIIKESNGGKYFESFKLREIVNYVYYVKENKAKIEQSGIAARKYIKHHFSKEKVLNEFKKTLFNLFDE